MSIANAHLSVVMLTSYLNDLNYKLSQITDKRQLLAAEEANIIQQNSFASMQTNNAIYTASAAAATNALNSTNSTDINSTLASLIAASSSSNVYNDPDIQLIELQDNNFDMQQKKLETQIKAVTANLDSQQKLLDNNIKKDFGSSLSIS